MKSPMATNIDKSRMELGQSSARGPALFPPDKEIGRGLPKSLPEGGHEWGWGLWVLATRNGR